MRTFLALAAAAVTVVALPYNAPHVLHEKRDADALHGFAKRDEVPAGVVLPVRIGLTQSNLDRGHDLLMEVSHPDSPRYGKHYTADEVIDLFAPHKNTVDAISEWLSAAGVKDFSQSVNKQWMQFDAQKEVLEELIRTKLYQYEQLETGDIHIACDEYHVPEHVTQHVDYITPGIKLLGGSVSKRSSNLSKRSGAIPPINRAPPTRRPLPSGVRVAIKAEATNINQCDRIVEPQCVRALYNITEPTTAVHGNELGIFEDLNDIYDQKDLTELWKITKVPKGTGPVNKPIDGAPGPVPQAEGGGESLLDLSLAIPLIYPQKVWLYQTDDAYYEANYEFSGFLNNFFDAIDGSYCKYCAFGECGNSELDPPYPDPNPGGYKGKLQCGKYRATNVISISYGGNEAGLPNAYQRRQCNEIMKLGMQGVSVVVASGDSGVGYSRGTNNADCLGANGTAFVPDFPATCPYITVAGGTYLPRGANVKRDAEVAVERFPSGGGFSNIYPRPDWQDAAVQNYLNFYNTYPTYTTKNDPYPSDETVGKGIFSRNGRAYPDVSAVGDNVFIYYAGVPYLIGGTSASAPVFASILTRINEERILANKSAVGFVNPTLYANPGAFHDITVGSNPNCASRGFLASPGWDPVTGLGTPNYPDLLKVFMALP